MTVPVFDLQVEINFGGASTSTYLHLDDLARGILDTATLGPTDGVWTDVTDYVHHVKVRRGATRVESPVPRYEAGTAVISLKNTDRRFDPTNLSGPYVSGGVTQVTPMRAVRILCTYDGTTYEVWRGFADSWRIYYEEPNYSGVELSCTDATKVLSNYTRTASGPVGAGDDSGARVDRILDSVGWAAADRIVATGDTTLQATSLEGGAWEELLLVQDTEFGELYIDEGGRVFFRNRQAAMEDLRSIAATARFGDDPATNVETTINLVTNPSLESGITGWAAGGSAPPTLSHTSAQALYGTDSLLITWDTGGLLPHAYYTVSGLTPGLTYTASMYVYVPTGSPAALLNWDAAFLHFGPPSTVNDAWTRIQVTGVATDTDVGIYLWPQVAPTAGDECYVDGFQFEEGSSTTTYCDGDQTNCEWDSTAHASTSRRLPELGYHDLELDYDDVTLANSISITRVGGSAQTATDSASQALYLTQTYSRDDLIMQTDTVANDYADFILFQTKDPELRFGSITIKAHGDPTNLLPQVLGRQFGDRIRIIRRPPGGGTISREVFIRGIEHEVDVGGGWITKWILQSTTGWTFLVLDSAALGLLDTGRLGF